jgi:hypothetical protein
MSRLFIDDELISWEAYASTGRFSLPDDGRLVFLCVTQPNRRPRTILIPGDAVAAGAAIDSVSDQRLRELLARSRELS